MNTLRLTGSLLLATLVAAPAAAQQVLQVTAFEARGVIRSIVPGGIEVQVPTGQVWQVRVEVGGRQPTRIDVEGEAVPEALQPGMWVRFTAEVDKRGRAVADVHEVTIFTPTPETPPGMHPAGLGPAVPLDGQPAAAPPAAGGDDAAQTMLVVGRVSNYRADSLTVAFPGGSVRVRLADEAAVRVAVNDLRLARPGDEVEVTGWYQQPPQATAQGLTVHLARKLGEEENRRKIRPGVAAEQANVPKGGEPGANPFDLGDPQAQAQAAAAADPQAAAAAAKPVRPGKILRIN